MTFLNRIQLLAGILLGAGVAIAQTEHSKYYNLETLPIPEGVVAEMGSIALVPGKSHIGVTTRRGDLYLVEGAYGDLDQVEWKLFAEGLHEPLGMFWKDGAFVLTQRPEVSRVSDTDGDGRADRFETISGGWGISGDYHEYAFGSDPDKDGNVWVVLCLTGSSGAKSDWRGWCVRVTPDGKMIPTTSGIRSPGGIGFNIEGDVFYTDNQGLWNGSQ